MPIAFLGYISNPGTKLITPAFVPRVAIKGPTLGTLAHFFLSCRYGLCFLKKSCYFSERKIKNPLKVIIISFKEANT
jgi:hypothetical protein